MALLKRRELSRILLLLIFGCFVFYVWRRWEPSTEIASDEDTLIFNLPLNQSWVPHDDVHNPREVICNRQTKECFVVVDMSRQNGLTRSVMAESSGPTLILTLSELKPGPRGNLVVDPRKVHQYVSIMVVAPALTGTLKTYAASTRILNIGLGGGSIPNIFDSLTDPPFVQTVELDPVMRHVAERWFNVVPSSRNRIFIGDGVQFVESSNEPYDVILLDGCSLGYNHEYICPAVAFLTSTFIRAAHNLLRPQGTLAINVAFGMSKKPDSFAKLMAKFETVFRSCKIFRANLNYVLVCSDRIGIESGRVFLENRFHNLPAELKELLRKVPTIVDLTKPESLY